MPHCSTNTVEHRVDTSTRDALRLSASRNFVCRMPVLLANELKFRKTASA
jgi:hypothetical protein